ncbi:MAG: hypothetical protein LBN95_05650, partial [Prevotellaceae bacterium]|nr:hypothetical protein [Prevotellaceae bacterium]
MIKKAINPIAQITTTPIIIYFLFFANHDFLISKSAGFTAFVSISALASAIVRYHFPLAPFQNIEGSLGFAVMCKTSIDYEYCNRKIKDNVYSYYGLENKNLYVVMLTIDQSINQVNNIGFNAISDDILRHLVVSRICQPQSKVATVDFGTTFLK